MKYEQIPNTNIKLSQLTFGGEWVGELTQEQTNDLMKHCHECGINMLDCWMSDPKIRDKLGIAMEGMRDDFYIQGHIGATWQNGQYKRTREITHVKEAFKDLLMRLKTDYIDFGMIHYVDEVSEYDEIMQGGEYLDYVYKLKSEGTIHHIGLSTHNPRVAIKAAENPDIELILFSLNPAYDIMPPTENIEDYIDTKKYENLAGLNPEREMLYEKCLETQTPIVVMKAFSGGRLLDTKDSPFDVAFTPLECIAYALDVKPAVSVCVGYKSTDEVDDTLRYFTVDPSELDYISKMQKMDAHSFEGTCTYCGHCLPCPQNIDIAMVSKLYDLATIDDDIPESIREHYDNLTVHASDCIKCMQCHKQCPFNVDIVEIMTKAEKLFGY
ncbi:MAG: aldo/keto reductase [Methanosphaera sp.]|uniref:aldo/keto reductase n=1 Tax=Methanosphaera sp. TaxID=2666342 RepID=UPI0025F3FF36|nr:aldo/keto reductase [Methanosphaera sp.]MCI5866600.1 aldo/keto reductase [Methanosphaera sp.]MDD6535080.1 aldo/keto reductase [Methanosphaera sp.]MDY3955512.1 aldo/keto reductase [Methanosphaera sp.]